VIDLLGGEPSRRLRWERILFSCVRLVYEKLRRGVESEHMYERGLKLNPHEFPIRERLRKMRAEGVGVGLGDSLRLRTAVHRFDILFEQLVNGDYSQQYMRAMEWR
jgi:hypothetical protein